jgi:hypothetical protein
MQIQAVNDAGNLLFFVSFLATAILVTLLVYRTFRGRPIRRIALAILVCWCAYAATLIAVSFSSETRSLTLGTDKCFDDWCAAVIGARSMPNPNGPIGTKLVAITLRVSNRARQAAFRPSQPRVSLLLASGDALYPSAVAQREFEKQGGPQEDLAKRLVAGDKFQTTLVFEVPAATREASVALLEGPAVLTRFLVGDENSFFHRKMVYPIQAE